MKIDSDKLDSVYTYLEKKFPDYHIMDMYDGDYLGQKFIIDNGKTPCLAIISRELFQDLNSQQIPGFLERHDLAGELLKKTGVKIVAGTKGLKIIE